MTARGAQDELPVPEGLRQINYLRHSRTVQPRLYRCSLNTEAERSSRFLFVYRALSYALTDTPSGPASAIRIKNRVRPFTTAFRV